MLTVMKPASETIDKSEIMVTRFERLFFYVFWSIVISVVILRHVRIIGEESLNYPMKHICTGQLLIIVTVNLTKCKAEDFNSVL